MTYHYSLGVHNGYEYALIKPGVDTVWGYLVRYPKETPYMNYREEYVDGEWERSWSRRAQVRPQRFDVETARLELAMMAMGDDL